MLYTIAHIIRDYFFFLWEWLESANSAAFKVKFRKKLKTIPELLNTHCYTLENKGTGKELCINLRLAQSEDAKSMAEFFSRQPEESYKYFRPHDFDEKTLGKLIKRTSFIIVIAECEGMVVGYSFLRSFVHGKTYLGKMVDFQWQGKGICKAMCKACMDIATVLGLHMYESINKKNPASMRSSASVLKQVVVAELENDDLLIEDFPL